MIPLLLALMFQPVTTYPKMLNPVRTERMTPLKLLQRNHVVKHGLVCFYPLEVRCIDGVCGDNDSYWEVSVNGDTRYHNANSPVKKSDVVRWTYASSKGK